MSKVLHGDAGGNQLNASSDKAQLYGLKGNDTLISDGKSDVLLVGGGGDDSLIVMGGEATLSGGDGADTFEFTYSADKKVSAVIEDLEPSKDKIVVKFDGNTAPQLTSTRSGNDVVWSDGDNFKITLKSVRENDYFDGEARQEIWDVLELTNAEREKENLPALTMSEGLVSVASIRADDIVELGVSGELKDHYRPNGAHSSVLVADDYHHFGENLEAVASVPAEVMKKWMESDDHKENILMSDFRKLGVGYRYFDEGDVTDHQALRYYWVQEFADSLTSAESVSTANLLSANIEKDKVSKYIQGSAQANEISNSDYGVTIDALDDDDFIQNTDTGLIVSISTGAGNDSIENSAPYVTINAGTGDDSIKLSSSAQDNLIQYSAGDGNDSIVGFNANSTLSISGSEYTPVMVGNDIIVSVGTDSINLVGAASLAASDVSNLDDIEIDGTRSKLYILTEENDTFDTKIENTEVTIRALGGDDFITNRNSTSTVEGMSGNDTISNEAGSVSIDGSTGDDSINNFGSFTTLTGGAGRDTIISNSNFSRDDELFINCIFVTISGGEGTDRIVNKTNDAVIYGGEVDDFSDTDGDYIDNSAHADGVLVNFISIYGGAGSDTIGNSGDHVLIYGFAGNDSIVNNQANTVGVVGGYGNDTIANALTDEAVIIEGSAGNDDIYIMASSNVTINPGRDNDKITLANASQYNVIQYSEGDGRDTISGFGETDSIIIGDGTDTFYGYYSGDNIILKVGTGFITLLDTANLTAPNIKGTFAEPEEENNIIYLTEDDTEYYNELEGATITPTNYDDYIENDGNDAFIYGSKGDDTINNWGNNASLGAGDGDDSIRNSGDNVLISIADGKDTVENVAGNSVSIMSGEGNHLINLGKNTQNNRVIHLAGNATVSGFKETDTLNVIEHYTRSTVGNDVVVAVGTDSVTLLEATDLSIINVGLLSGEPNIEGNVLTFDDGGNRYTNRANDVIIRVLGGNDSISNFGENVLIEGASGDDILYSYASNVTIDGSEGADSISNGVGLDDPNLPAGNSVSINGGDGDDDISNWGDTVTVDGGDGDDTIDNHGNTVTIHGGEGKDSIDIRNSSNVTVDAGEGDDSIENRSDSISIDGGADDDHIWSSGSSVTIAGGDGKDVISNGDVYNSGGSNVSINSGADDDSIFNIGTEVSIISGEGDDSIDNYADNVTIDSGEGDDTVNNGDTLTSVSGKNVIIDLGAGNDRAFNLKGADNVSILGGTGNDSLYNEASNVSILGGVGNDSISLSSDAENTFIDYTNGDGNDTIWGLDANDSLKVPEGAHSLTSDVEGEYDVIWQVGENSILLKGVRERPPHVIIGESGTSGGDSGNDSGNGGDNGSGNGNDGRGNGDGSATSGGKSSNEGRGSDATSGKSASNASNTGTATGNNGGNDSSNTAVRGVTSNVSNVSNDDNSSSGGGNASRRNIPTTPSTPSTSTTSSTVSAQLNADASQPSASSSATPKISLNAPTYANNPSGEDVVAAIQSGNEAFKKHWGTEGNDTLYGGEGVDLFISGKNQGSDTFLNISAEDIVYLSDVTLNDLIGIKKTGDTVSISLKTGNTMTIQSSDSVSGAIVFADTTWHFTHNSQA